MAVPKRKTSKSKRDMRQAGKGLKKNVNIKLDANGIPILAHNIVIIREKKKKEENAEK